MLQIVGVEKGKRQLSDRGENKVNSLNANLTDKLILMPLVCHRLMKKVF